MKGLDLHLRVTLPPPLPIEELPDRLPEVESPLERRRFLFVELQHGEKEGDLELYFYGSTLSRRRVLDMYYLLLKALEAMKAFTRLPVAPVWQPDFVTMEVGEPVALLLRGSAITLLATGEGDGMARYRLLVRGLDGWWLLAASSARRLEETLSRAMVGNGELKPYATKLLNEEAVLTAVLNDAAPDPLDHAAGIWGEESVVALLHSKAAITRVKL